MYLFGFNLNLNLHRQGLAKVRGGAEED